MTGYIRQDTANNISNGGVIDADDLDAEFDALEDAFSASVGHVHDGTSGNGAPILVVGPAQNVTVSSTSMYPKTNNVTDLGTSSLQYKDLWIDGTANIDALVADTADINGGTIDATVIGGTTAAAGSFTTVNASGTITGNVTGALTGNAATATKLLTARTITLSGDVAGSASFDGSANVTISATVQANSVALGTDTTGDYLAGIAGTTNQVTVTSGTGEGASPVVSLPATLVVPGTLTVTGAATITSGSISGITDLAIADGGTGASTAANARTNLGLGTIATQASSSVSITGGSITGITDLAVADGGTGASTLTGYVKGAGTTALTASATIPNTDITGLGTMSTQAASAVAITGGTISGITDLAVADGGTGASDAAGARTNLGLGTIATQAASSVTITGGSISGITDLGVADGGTGASTLTGYVKGAGTTALTASATIPNTDITGLGTMSTQAASAVAITGGTVNGTTLGATTAAAASVTTLAISSSVTEAVFAVTGTTPALSAANGTIQTWSLTANSTPTSSLTTGQSITLMVLDGVAYTITWPSVTWVNSGGLAPVLSSSQYTTIVLWNVAGTLYGALVGNAL